MPPRQAATATRPEGNRHEGRPPLRRLAVDLGLGLVAATGLAPWGLWPATLIALAVFLWRLTRTASVFWPVLAAGLGWFLLALSWITEPFLVDIARYGWMAPFALILMGLGGALFWAVPAALAARYAPTMPARLVAVAVALILSDWMRGWIFTGFPWAQLGHVWIDTPVAQLAAWLGAPGLGVVTMAIAMLSALPHRMGPAAAVIVLAGAWLGGQARLSAPMPPDRDVMVRVVQPNAEQRLKWDPEWSAIFLQRLMDLSAEPGDRDLVIWPETAVNFLLEDAPPLLPAISQAAGAPLIMGIQRRDGVRFYNSLAVIAPDGQVGQVYDKFHLVPFGEYVPWGDALSRIGITAFAAQQGNGYTPGPGPATLSVPGAPDLQPLICYEAIFAQHLRGLDQRPGWLLQATNDAWFGQISGPYQHLDQARLRSIETGLPLIRAANTGVSAIIDARGRVIRSLPLNEPGKIDAALPGALPPTLWLRTGNAPLLSLLIVILAAALWAPRRRPATV